MLIGLSGYAGAGKDTVGGILVKHAGYTRVAFADKVREALLKVNPFVLYVPQNNAFAQDYFRLSNLVEWYGWDQVKRNSSQVREQLQRMGTEVGRGMFGDDVWVNLALGDEYEPQKIVVTDVRFPNEARGISDRGGVVLRVHRDGHGPVNSHISETALDNYRFTADVYNNGSIQDLYNEVQEVLWAMTGFDEFAREVSA